MAARWRAAAATLAVTVAAAVPAGAAAQSPAESDAAEAAGAVVQQISTAAQGATHEYWTRARMAHATVLPDAVSAGGAPRGTPTATMFAGVPTVGALFFTAGSQAHFCTAGVVASATRNLVLTAAHCVYSNTYATNIEFVPGYHNGQQPYGAWPVRAITVAQAWQHSQDPNVDFAFLDVEPSTGSGAPIQDVTGGLRLGIDSGYDHRITVIGYNDTDDAPVECATASFEFEPLQQQFNCHDYWDGTSGAPWITDFDPKTGTGTVVGDIGGYQQGGNFEYTSYSPYFGPPTLQLFNQAQGIRN